MISCWISENNGWKYACHNTVSEQLRLIHICQDSQAASLFDSWDYAVVYPLAGENFLASDDKGRAMALGFNLCHLAISQVHSHLPGALQPSSPSGASHAMCSWLATHCDLPGCGAGLWRQGEAGKGRERQGEAVPAARFLEAQKQLEESTHLCEPWFQCLGLYGFYGCMIA